MMLKLLSLWPIVSLLVAAPLNPNLEKNGTEDDLVTDEITSVGQDNDDTTLNSTRDPRLTIEGGNINFSGEISSSGNNAKINIGSISSDLHLASQEETNVQGVWTAWTKCSQTCEGGIRKRTCTNPAPGNDSKKCTGDDFQSCNDDVKCTPSGMECYFNDEQLADIKKRSGDLTPHDINTKYQWKKENNVIPYYFTSVSSKDKQMFRSVMNIIEENSCFKFEEKTKVEYESKHCLEIKTGSKSCVSGCQGYVGVNSERLLLKSDTQVSDKEDCELQCKGFVLHELMHVLGVGHTFRRSDRDDYITINEANLDSLGLDIEGHFAKCKDCKIYPDIPYDCDSIMHYGTHCNSTEIMMPKNPNTCNLKKQAKLFDGPIASDLDWQLLNIIGDCAGVVGGVPVPVGVTGRSNGDATSRLEVSMRFLRDQLKEYAERNFKEEEKSLLKEMRETKMYLEENCANENGNCDSPTIESYAEKWLLILQKMIEDGELTSGYMDAFEKDFEVLEAAVKAAQKVNKQTQQSVTECNPNNEGSCSCGDDSCTDGQFCTAGKCLDVCEIKDKEPLTADCFCIHGGEGSLCPEGDGRNICSKHGCLTNVNSFFFLVFFG